MNYKETLNYLYSQLPMFERQGGAAYKPGLQVSTDLDNLWNNPHRAYKCIHVGGTNGKGSVSHLLATILQQCGYKVGLYTSPHIVDFRERIKVNGEMMPKEKVTEFMAKYFAMGYEGHPTFFELTSTMAMDYFRQCAVDYAVIEVGLGGRLDSTNIIAPVLSIITNISLDHTQFLGNTLTEIAGEKAGIIKQEVPVVIGEAQGEVRAVFEAQARATHSPIVFAQDMPQVIEGKSVDGHNIIETVDYGTLTDELGGDFQVKNANTVLTALNQLKLQGATITPQAVAYAFEHVCQLSGFIGRWQQLGSKPLVLCDSGHNVGAFRQIVQQLAQEHYKRLHMVIGFMKDKDVDNVLALLPTGATYYFTQAQSERALPALDLQVMAKKHEIEGQCYDSVERAYRAALGEAQEDDMVYVGGSMYVLAELLSLDLRG